MVIAAGWDLQLWLLRSSGTWLYIFIVVIKYLTKWNLRNQEFALSHSSGACCSQSQWGNYEVDATCHIQSGSKERDVCWYSSLFPPFPILFSTKAQPMKWCRPHSGQVFSLSQTSLETSLLKSRGVSHKHPWWLLIQPVIKVTTTLTVPHPSNLTLFTLLLAFLSFRWKQVF